MDNEDTITDEFNAIIDNIVSHAGAEQGDVDFQSHIKGTNPVLWNETVDFLRRHTAGHLLKHHHSKYNLRTMDEISKISLRALEVLLSNKSPVLDKIINRPVSSYNFTGQNDFIDTDLTFLLQSAYLLSVRTGNPVEIIAANVQAAYSLGRYRGLNYDAQSHAGKSFVARAESSRKNSIRNQNSKKVDSFISTIFGMLPEDEKLLPATVVRKKIEPTVNFFINELSLNSPGPQKRRHSIESRTLEKKILEEQKKNLEFNSAKKAK